MRRSALLVLGPHRSGTSFVAGSLCLAGVPFGSSLAPSGPDNPKGFFEDENILALHEELLGLSGSHWSDIRPDPLSGAPADVRHEAIPRIIQTWNKTSGHETWFGFKDPRTLRFCAAWRQALSSLDVSANAVLVIRRPHAVIASLLRRDGIDRAWAESLWLADTIASIDSAQDIPHIVVDYDMAISDPAALLRHAKQFLAAPCPNGTEAARNLVDHSLNHAPNDEQVAPSLERLHTALREIAARDTPIIRGNELVSLIVAGRAHLADFQDAHASELSSNRKHSSIVSLYRGRALSASRWGRELQERLVTIQHRVDQLGKEAERREQEIKHLRHQLHTRSAKMTEVRDRIVPTVHAMTRGLGTGCRRAYDLVFPAGSRRHACLAAVRAAARHPGAAGWALARGDLALIAHALDSEWAAARARDQPYVPPNWLQWCAPMGSRRRLTIGIVCALLRSPIALARRLPPRKWRAGWRLLKSGEFHEIWMHVQVVRGEALRRKMAAQASAPGEGQNARARSHPHREPRQSPPADPAQIRLPDPGANPTVSVVIPAHNNWDLTLACLHSIAMHPQATSMEVILADDASTDTTATEATKISGLRIFRSPKNLGFLRNCNQAANNARGRWLCFLNNDTEVLPGWLDALVATAIEDARVGAVGARLLFPDGSLQEAGSIVFSDGSAANWGIHTDPYLPVFAHAREADYCSAACLLVDKSLFLQGGGFDERYAPAYYEDTDLAFRIRSVGRKVVYQPASTVKHFGGASCGVNATDGIKHVQERNRAIFFTRWETELSNHLPPGSRTPDGTGRRLGIRRVLFIDERLPTPDRDAGSHFLCEFMRVFHDLGYRVTFTTQDGAGHGTEADALRRNGIEVVLRPHSGDAAALLSARGGSFHVVVLVRHHVASTTLQHVMRHAPQAKRIFLPADLHWLRNERQARLRNDATAAEAARRLEVEEMRAVQSCSATIVHSSHERSLLSTRSPKSLVACFPLIVRACEDVPGPERRSGLAFIGGCMHRPNLDAILYLIREIWPLVRDRLPSATLTIIGADPPPAVLALAGNGVNVAGHVPDLASTLSHVRATIAPLRWGAGAKGKVATSMAYGVPVVCTPIAAEGMGLSVGEDILSGDTSEALAEACVRVLTDDCLWRALSQRSLSHCREHWSSERTAERTIALLGRLAVPPTHLMSDRIRAEAIKAIGAAELV